MAQTCANPHDPYLVHFRELMDLAGAETLLDVGCGPGSVSLCLANEFKETIGIDYSRGMLEMAKLRAKNSLFHMHALNNWHGKMTGVHYPKSIFQ